MHGRTHHLNPQRNQWIEIEIERIAKWRHENHCSRRPRLMMIVNDLRKPFQEHLPVHAGSFRHVRHIEITIVVVPDVLVIKLRKALQTALQRVRFAHVPVGNQFLAIGVRRHAKDDVVVEKTHRIHIGSAQQLVYGFNELLGTNGLIGVQAAINPDDGFTLARQLPCGRFTHTFGMSQLLRNALVFREVL